MKVNVDGLMVIGMNIDGLVMVWMNIDRQMIIWMNEAVLSADLLDTFQNPNFIQKLTLRMNVKFHTSGLQSVAV